MKFILTNSLDVLAPHFDTTGSYVDCEVARGAADVAGRREGFGDVF